MTSFAGHVVWISAAYAASKAAGRTIGQTLSMELVESSVTCTTLHRGGVESDLARVGNDNVYRDGRDDPRPAALTWPTDKA